MAKSDKASKSSSKKSKKTTSKKIKQTKQFLKKEVDLPIPEGKSKTGKFFTKKRKARVPMPQYFRDSWQELKKVTWPNRKETIKLSTAVVIFTLLFALIVALMDYGFDRLVERVFL